MIDSLRLADFAGLINLLDYRRQAFQTKEAYWDKFAHNAAFKSFHDRFFLQETINISRGAVLDQAKDDFQATVFSVILWGYPKNPRGGHFESILQNLQLLEARLSYGKDLSEDDFGFLSYSLKGTGIGLSTLSKLLYFFNIRINSYNCLILDRWVLSILQKRTFHEFASLASINETNKGRKYISYIKLMGEAANSMAVLPDQLELFLFQFGKALNGAKNAGDVAVADTPA